MCSFNSSLSKVNVRLEVCVRVRRAAAMGVVAEAGACGVVVRQDSGPNCVSRQKSESQF